MPTFAVLADVRDVQNPQDLGSLWGELEAEIRDLGGSPGESYAVAGEYDLLLTYEADDTETALEVAIGMERHGIDTRTMPVVPIERLGEIVEDI